MRYKVLACDFDGTFYTDHFEIPTENIKAMNEYISAGGDFLFATGRLFSAIEPHLKVLNINKGYVICQQGATIYDIEKRKSIYEIPLPYKLGIKTLIYLEALENVVPLIFYNDRPVSYIRNEFVDAFEKIMQVNVQYTDCKLSEYVKNNNIEFTKILLLKLPFIDSDFIEQLKEKCEPELSVNKASEYLLEIVSSKASKGGALERYAKEKGISAKNIAAIGNAENDISMLEWAGLSIAVADSMDPVKAVADVVCESSLNAGVADAIYKYILNDTFNTETDKNLNTNVEEVDPKQISVEDFAKACSLDIEYAEENDMITLSSMSVNRPGLFLAGFSDYFAKSRVQVLGNAETFYLRNLSVNKRSRIVSKLFATQIPCIILARGVKPSKDIVRLARKNKTPVFRSNKVTSDLINEITMFLNEFLSNNITISAGLMDINGVGVLITGDSGIGKSETALDLITRGHKLIADDVVQLARVKDEIIGTAPEKTKFYMEVRGLGIIDVRLLYGVGAVINEKKVDLIIHLQKTDDTSDSERLCKDENVQNLLGIDILTISIPVAVGRNLSIIIEVAARNYRLRKLGIIAVDEFLKKIKN